MADVNAQLREIASRTVNSIADVIAVFEAIDRALPESDGLKWFNSALSHGDEGRRSEYWR